MKFHNIIFILYICINLINTLNNSEPNIAVFPFKTFYYPIKTPDQSYSPKEYMDIIQSSMIHLDIEIGKNIKNENLTKELKSKFLNNKQFLSLFVIIDKYDFYIDDNYFYNPDKKKYCLYSSFLSTSYEVDNSYSYNLKDAVIASDYIKVFKEKTINNNYNFLKINFRHSYDKNNNISFSCGNIGLLVPTNKLYIESKTNFINQIHYNLDNIDYSFSIQYNKKENLEDMNDGFLIIGEESIEKKLNPEIIPIYSRPKGYGSSQEWEFDINQISIGNKKMENEDSNFDILIKSSIDGIQIPYFFYQELNDLYFNKYYSKQICQYEPVNNLYIIIYCDSDKFTHEDINLFPEINFLNYKLGFNFTFTGKELLVKKGNKYFFKMVTYFQRHLKSFFFGRLFLKKYKVIFNSDSKAIYFFDINKNINIIKNDVADKKIFDYKYFINIFIGCFFLIIGLFLGRRYCIKRRKLYANELEDDNYIYESKDINNNEKKLIL